MKGLPEKPHPMFFLANYSCTARKNLQEMHFKTEGTGTVANLCSNKTYAVTERNS